MSLMQTRLEALRTPCPVDYPWKTSLIPYAAGRGIGIIDRAINMSGRSVVRDETPEDEGFEHNDLTGNYDGDTGVFNIQNETVSEGSYALSGEGGGSTCAIVRDESGWYRSNLKMTYEQYLPNVSGNGGVILATNNGSYNNLSGYMFYSDAGVNGNTFLSRVDNGSRTHLDGVTNGESTGMWVQNEINFYDDGEIEWKTETNGSFSSVDKTYTNLKLGFITYRGIHIDNVQFELLQ